MGVERSGGGGGGGGSIDGAQGLEGWTVGGPNHQGEEGRLLSGGGGRQPLNSLWALPVYPIFEHQKLEGPEEKSAKQKIALKRPPD